MIFGFFDDFLFLIGETPDIASGGFRIGTDIISLGFTARTADNDNGGIGIRAVVLVEIRIACL